MQMEYDHTDPRSPVMESIGNELHTAPIIYSEDRTYTHVPTEEGRQKVRQWRFQNERRLGLYNAAVDHRCSDACFEPLTPFGDSADGHRKRRDRRALVNKLTGNDDDDDDDDVDKRADSSNRTEMSRAGLVVETIDRNLSLFGCPLSGQIHVCPLSAEERRYHCMVIFEDNDGATHCRFSGRTIKEMDYIYNPFTETSVSVDKYLHREDKSTREIRAVTGEGAATAHDAHHRNTIEAMREKGERQDAINLNKNLQSKLQRRVPPTTTAPNITSYGQPQYTRHDTNHQRHMDTIAAAAAPSSSSTPIVVVSNPHNYPGHAHTVPSLESPIATASPSKRASPFFMGATSASAVSTSSTPPRGGGGGGTGGSGDGVGNSNRRGRRNTHVDLGHDLFVTRDTFAKIRVIVLDLLTDEEGNQMFNAKADALNPSSDLTYIDFCCRRVACVYALVREEGDQDRLRAHTHLTATPSQRAQVSARNRRQGACTSVNVKDVAVAVLYMYARGMTMDGGQTLIPRDARLFELLPPPKALMWYGIEKGIRRELRKNPGAKMIKELQKYSEQSPTEAFPKIQQAIHAAMDPNGRGPFLLKQILNATLIVARSNHQETKK